MTEMRAKLVVDADGSSIIGMAQKTVSGLDAVMDAAVKTASGFKQLTTHSNGVETGFRHAVSALVASDTALGRVQAGATGLSQALRSQSADLIATQRETAAWTAQLNQVRARFDPLFAATTRYEQELRDIAAAEKMGALSAQTAAAARSRATAGYNALTGAQDRVTKSSKLMRGGIQNASYQVADAAVQLQMGTAASMVFAQQMPQLLGGMGVMGAAMGAVVAVGTPLITMLLTSEDSAGTLDERLDKLDGSLQSVTDRLKLLRDQDLSLTFGSMAGDVRTLTSTLLDLDRAAELKNLRNTLEGLLQENIEPGFWQKLSQSISLGAAPMPGLTTEDYLTGNSIARGNYNDLTGGRGPSFEEFDARRENITGLAKAGEVEQVTAEIKSLITDFAGDTPITDMNDELVKMLLALGDVAQKTAEVEAQFNGSSLSARLDKETASMVSGYQQQAELAATILQFGEHSAEVEVVRNRQAKEAVALRLRELGVEEDSVRERDTLAQLEKAQVAEVKLRAAEREKSITATLTGLSDELALSQSIISYGENSVEVEQLRTEQARQTLAIRLKEIGATEDQIAQAEELLKKQREAAQEAKTQKAEKEAGKTLTDLRAQADINAAILQYGKDSLEVKRLQIDAARAEYVQSLATMQVSEATKANLLAQWDITKGMKGIDPFGTLSSAQSILQAQTKSIAKLQLEQNLIGQSEATKRRVLALYEAELDIRQKGIDVEGELAARIREGALAESDLAAEVQRQADAWGDVQSSAEDAIDGILDALLDGDISGALESIAEDIKSLFTELAIKNPLKNAILGTDYATMDDVGGLGGIWDRLTGKVPAIDPAAAAAKAAAQSVATMQVTAANVTISTMGGLGLGGLGNAANINGLPGSSDVQSQIAAFFSGKGLAPHQVAGIMGNISAESAFNPAAVGDGGTSFGLFQHHAGRGQSLLNAVGGMGGLGDVQAQLEHVWEELLTSENGVLKKLMASTNVQEATSAFVGFERPAGWSAANPMGAQNWSGRLAAAEQAMTQFNSATSMATQGLGTLGNGFDSFGQALAGAITGGGGGSDLLGMVLGAIIPGFATGGATGGSDPQKVAGVVHEKEYVFDAASTARIGVQNLEAIRRGTMKGYASGGYVSSARAYPFLTQGGGNGGGASVIQLQPVLVNNTSVPMQMEVEETTDSRGQRQQKYVLSDAVAQGVTTKGGKAQRAMKGTYGLKRQGISR
ncbi:phage tail tip lysozyme [Celeribacter baekdonensis]|uniref:phage tail tip lysozyme n=1 Tax=Celeribacter baekdonensis TaxID=875171 RepID=UPI0030DD0B2F|tara:strand:- start:7442 stop:11089 length:3648 start_codon:yes stop_codon:yes gene_type:complete